MSAGFPGPLRSDHGEDHVALADCRIDVFAEVFTERNGIDVHEDGIAAEVSTKTVVDPSGNADRVLAPIREKDPRHRAVAMSVLLLSPVTRTLIREYQSHVRTTTRHCLNSSPKKKPFRIVQQRGPTTSIAAQPPLELFSADRLLVPALFGKPSRPVSALPVQQAPLSGFPKGPPRWFLTTSPEPGV